MRYLLFTILTLLYASTVFAAVGDFVPIAPLPNGLHGEIATSNNLGFYLNAIFQLALSAGAALAAIYIAIGGFEYIFAEAMETKKNGRLRIVHALYGLAILLMVTMILYIIGGSKAIDLCINFISGTCN